MSRGEERHEAVSGASSAPTERDRPSGSRNIVRYLCDIGDFVRRLRIQARFGELSREPLELLRLELRGAVAECEWIARRSDPWDEELPPGAGDRHASMQALQDAIAIRDLLFRTLQDLRSAEIRVYRRDASDSPELIVGGGVARAGGTYSDVRSLPMRAKLLGLQFHLEDGVLKSLQQEQQGLTLTANER